jgi:hypothetical protein
VSDANVLVRPDPPLSEHDEAGIIAAAVELGIMHSDDESRRLLRVAVGEVHRLTLLLEETRGDHRRPPRQAQAEGGPRGSDPDPGMG